MKLVNEEGVTNNVRGISCEHYPSYNNSMVNKSAHITSLGNLTKPTNEFPDTLILITTYRCNFSCRYCPVDRSEESMDERTALKALDEFLSHTKTSRRVRFFGGEPLLAFPILLAVVSTVLHRKSTDDVLFDVTTNASLLDEESLDFFWKNPRIELILSLDGPEHVHIQQRRSNDAAAHYRRLMRMSGRLAEMPGVTINKVVSPDNVSSLIHDFEFIRELGFRRINILPAFYLPWPRTDLVMLKRQFDALALKAACDMRKPEGLILKNLNITAKETLFNHAMVVDTDGGVYSSNHIMHRLLRPLRKEVLRTELSVFNPEALSNCSASDAAFIRKHISRELRVQTGITDRLLNYFVERVDKLHQ